MNTVRHNKIIYPLFRIAGNRNFPLEKSKIILNLKENKSTEAINRENSYRVLYKIHFDNEYGIYKSIAIKYTQ